MPNCGRTVVPVSALDVSGRPKRKLTVKNQHPCEGLSQLAGITGG